MAFPFHPCTATVSLIRCEQFELISIQQVRRSLCSLAAEAGCPTWEVPGDELVRIDSIRNHPDLQALNLLRIGVMVQAC